jgi:hypothetical protein
VSIHPTWISRNLIVDANVVAIRLVFGIEHDLGFIEQTQQTCSLRLGGLEE